jgi:phosphatidylserine decarboxylase
MLKRLLCYSQYILPQHLISVLMGRLANSKNTRLKNWCIDTFSRKYAIDLNEALIQDPHAYPDFNAFFTRALKAGLRPVSSDFSDIASPADGTIAEFGRIHNQTLLQAKGMYFDLLTLLGNQADAAKLFDDGHFATIYLAPNNYHRVHMPMTGTLLQSIYIPGRLFSVNRMTSRLIPNLYARNERLVLIFNTKSGPMAVILVGALIVGSMQTVWMDEPIRSHQIEVSSPSTSIILEKGAEVGRFLLGSTAIVLLPGQEITWNVSTISNNYIQTGQTLGTILS